MRAIASSASATKEQDQIIQDFAIEDGLKLNSRKTEIVEISQSNSHEVDRLHIPDDMIKAPPHALATCGLTT